MVAKEVRVALGVNTRERQLAHVRKQRTGERRRRIHVAGDLGEDVHRNGSRQRSRPVLLVVEMPRLTAAIVRHQRESQRDRADGAAPQPHGRLPHCLDVRKTVLIGRVRDLDDPAGQRGVGQQRPGELLVIVVVVLGQLQDTEACRRRRREGSGEPEFVELTVHEWRRRSPRKRRGCDA